MKADELKKEFGAEYPAVVRLDGVRVPLCREGLVVREGRRRLTFAPFFRDFRSKRQPRILRMTPSLTL